MANALRLSLFNGMAPMVKVTVDNFEAVLRNERGIIFFKDYWRRSGESFSNRSGDHIDLWNGKRITTLSSYFRIQWGVHFDGVYSDFFKSQEIWFWKIR
ncbi:type VI secretion system amidase effector protein Tae4 [Erwinia tracheiphila]|nr:T6SS effector amidase Tae4 family protein [Erwinia tracheiphila]UIA82979.1 type VI secretion system amidase effector protein Tae4 [Erwinia tracheiphila]